MHFGQAYGVGFTPEQSLDAVKAVAQTIKRTSVKLEFPEEARRFGVQAMSLVGRKQYDEAVKSFDQGLALAPWWAEGHYNRALVLANQNHHTEAVASLKAFLVLAPASPDAREAQDKIYEWELKTK
jgi:tetratricopeptide (TPR) repeat protein